MDCERAREWIQIELDGELGPDRIEELSLHALICESCRRRREDLARQEGLLGELGNRRPPVDIPAFEKRFLAALRGETEPVLVRAAPRRIWFAGARIAAAAALLAVGFSFGRLAEGRGSPGRTEDRAVAAADGTKGAAPRSPEEAVGPMGGAEGIAPAPRTAPVAPSVAQEEPAAMTAAFFVDRRRAPEDRRKKRTIRLLPTTEADEGSVIAVRRN